MQDSNPLEEYTQCRRCHGEFLTFTLRDGYCEFCYGEEHSDG